MTQPKDLIAGFFARYDEFDRIACWANSLDQSGFTGDKLVVCGATKPEVISELRDRNYKVYEVDVKAEAWGDINIERRKHFKDVFAIVPNFDDYRYVLVTDMADVIFQKNPSQWLTEHAHVWPLLAAKEGCLHGIEGPNADRIRNNYGEAAMAFMADKPICNAGTICGTPAMVKRLFADMCTLAETAQGQVRDQATYNMLIQSEAYKPSVLFVPEVDGWACQVALSVLFRHTPGMAHYVEGEPSTFTDDCVRTARGESFAMVHQYTYIEDWNERMVRRYGGHDR